MSRERCQTAIFAEQNSTVLPVKRQGAAMLSSLSVDSLVSCVPGFTHSMLYRLRQRSVNYIVLEMLYFAFVHTELLSVAFIPPNLESKSGATFPPQFSAHRLRFRPISNSSFPFYFGLFPPLGKKFFLKGADWKKEIKKIGAEDLLRG